MGIILLMIIAIALILCAAYINYQKTKCIVACIKFQDEEIDKLRDMIKGQETDAIIQIRGRLARLENEIKVLWGAVNSIDGCCGKLSVEVEKLQEFKVEE